MKVVIIGAGVGGLAAALALTADGHDVTVFEQAPDLRRGGAAVTLWSNGTGILGELNVTLDGTGAPIDVLETRDHRGKLLVSIDVAQAAARYGHPHICLPRARLLERLAEGLPASVIKFGRACTGVVPEARKNIVPEARKNVVPEARTNDFGSDGPSVRATFEDGTTADADLLIGADGRGSVVRDQIWGGDPGELTGWATWQGINRIPIAIASSHRSVLFVGRAGTCGLMPAGEGWLQWWFDRRWAPGAAPTVQPTGPGAPPLAALRDCFGSWAEPIPAVLDALTGDDVGFFAHYRHAVPRAWGAGRVTVIGDAAHSMPPTRAQGANQALEDAWAMARSLRTNQDVPAALRAFERERSAKASVVSRQAGSEDYNRYGSVLARLLPSPLASRYYTRWLGQISTYLAAA